MVLAPGKDNSGEAGVKENQNRSKRALSSQLQYQQERRRNKERPVPNVMVNEWKEQAVEN